VIFDNIGKGGDDFAGAYKRAAAGESEKEAKAMRIVEEEGAGTLKEGPALNVIIYRSTDR
jgi:hypothetical protein